MFIKTRWPRGELMLPGDARPWHILGPLAVSKEPEGSESNKNPPSI
jgi:hypothetical protein